MKTEIERLRKNDIDIFERIDKIKNEIIDIQKRLGVIALDIKDNKIDDLLNDSQTQKRIREISQKHGRKTAIKWSTVIAVIMGILQYLEGLL